MNIIPHHQITLNIAGFVTCLKTSNELIATKLHKRYGAFIKPTITPHLTITIDATPNVSFIPIAPGNWIIETDYQDNTFSFKSYREKGTEREIVILVVCFNNPVSRCNRNK